jgi:hypothetical protein
VSNKKRKVKGVKAVVPVKKGHRVNSFNVLQRELAGYFKESGVDWHLRSGKSSFASVAGAVYKSLPDEVRKGGGKAVSAYVDVAFNDTFPVVVSPKVPKGKKKKGEKGGVELRLSDLRAIFGRFGGATNWWLFYSTMQELTAITPEFKSGDTVDFEGAGILNNYVGISTTQAGGAAWEIHSEMKRIFNDGKRRRPYSGVAIMLDEDESIARSSSENLVIVFSLQPDVAIEHLQSKNKILSVVTTIDDRKSGEDRVVGVEKGEQKTGVTVTPEAEVISEKEQHKIRMAELAAKAKIEAIELKKLDKKIAADIKKTALKSKEKIAIERIKSKERTEKVKSLERLFASGKLTYEQYREMMKQVK